MKCGAQHNVQLTPLHLRGDLSKRYSFQFSSTIVKGDSLILISEKCGKVYILNKNDLTIISAKAVFPIDQIESIEGAALYKDRYLFLLDENTVCVYCYDLQGQTPFKKIASKELLGSNNEGLLEGIAINEEQSICYILQEESGKIMLFDIQPNFNLKKRIDTSDINLPPKGWTRHTDLYFEKNKLYVLNTDYPRSNPTRYGIDVFSVDTLGSKLEAGYNSIELTSFKGLGNIADYSTNLEGFAKEDNTFYVVSDNHQSDMINCQACPITDYSCKLTLLFKFITQVK